MDGKGRRRGGKNDHPSPSSPFHSTSRKARAIGRRPAESPPPKRGKKSGRGGGIKSNDGGTTDQRSLAALCPRNVCELYDEEQAAQPHQCIHPSFIHSFVEEKMKGQKWGGARECYEWGGQAEKSQGASRSRPLFARRSF
ncbi:hypothetical protein niasHT_014058 [Heterodera trifolii]|uniref:Uncharacterized protein n=1 Tax=Heterodera trifolii TaxID=157864 RepID=A0ABD2LGA9_9BILA